MADDFVDYRLFSHAMIKKIGGGASKDDKYKNDAPVVVGTWQTVVKQPKEWFSQFGMMMNDECHLATGKSISSIISGLNNCMFKFGLSGSLRDGKANIMQYVGMFGEIFKPVTTSKLMEDGQVTELKINSIFLRYPDEFATKLKRSEERR